MRYNPFKKQKKQQGRRPITEAGRPKTAFSYYAGDAPRVKNNVKARQHNDKRQSFLSRLRLIPTVIAVAVILLSIVYSTTLTTRATITFVGPKSPYRSNVEYQQGIEKLLVSSYWNKNKLTINTNTTEAAILKTFPEIDAANVALPIIGRRPTVLLHARVPAFLLTTQSNVYAIDMTGRVVAKADQLMSSQKEELLTVQDQSGLEIKIGSQAVTTQTVIFIMNVKAQLADKKLTISQIVLPAVPNEIDFRITGQGYYIKAQSSGDARIQMGDYLAAKGSGAQPSEYMDVRVEDKVFYK